VNSFQQRIEALAKKFAQDVVAALSGGTLSDLFDAGLTVELTPDHRAKGSTKILVADKPTRKPRKAKRMRRTAANIATTAKDIVDLVTKQPNHGAEDIRNALGIKKAEWLKPIALALTMGLKKSGKKRSTVYYVGAAKVAKNTKNVKNATRTAPKRAKRTVLAAGDPTSKASEPTNGTSSQIEVTPVLTAQPS